jgi:hypothetical protein
MGTLMTAELRDHRPSTLVWIDAREAVIIHLRGDLMRLERMESDVPAHHRSSGHVRHDPSVRHGGGGPPQSAGEPHRIEHLDRFVGAVANHLADGDDLLILGPGTVHERLARHVTERGSLHRSIRDVACQTSPRMTDRQLVARLRRFVGVEPRRQSLGAYRWSEPPPHRPSGQVSVMPRRVVDKPRHGHRPEAPDE